MCFLWDLCLAYQWGIPASLPPRPFLNKLNFLTAEFYRIIAKTVQRVLASPPLVSPIVNISHWDTAFVMINEPILTHYD